MAFFSMKGIKKGSGSERQGVTLQNWGNGDCLVDRVKACKLRFLFDTLRQRKKAIKDNFCLGS